MQNMFWPVRQRQRNHGSSPLRRAIAVLAWGASVATAKAQGSGAAGPELAQLASRLVAAARNSNADVRAARAARATAVAQRGAAGFASPTWLQATATDAPRFDVGSGNVQIELGRELFTGERRAAARSRADAELTAAEAELSMALAVLDARVLRALAFATGAIRVERRLAASVELLEESEAVLRARFAAGDARYLDVLRLRTERLQARAELAGAHAEAAAGRAELETVIGDALDAAALDAALDSAASDAAALGWAAVLAARVPGDSIVRMFPDVRAAAASEARAVVAVRELVASQRGLVTGSIGLQRIGPANGGPGFGLALGLGTTLPFTARDGMRAGRAAASSAVTSAGASRTAATVSARGALRAARARFAAAIERMGSLDAALLVAAASERETAVASYRAGTLPLLDLLDFERALQRFEISRVLAVRDAAAALDALYGDGAATAGRP